MRIKSFFHVIGAISFLSLVGCSHQPSPMGKPLPDLNYAHLTPLSINGGAFDIQYSYSSREDDIEDGAQEANYFVLSPEVVLNNYAQNRFVTTGMPAKATFDIEKTQILYYPAKASSAVLFGGDGYDDIYKANIIVSINPLPGSHIVSGAYDVNVKRTLRIPKRYSLAEREFRQFEFLEKIVRDIDGAVMDIVTNKLLISELVTPESLMSESIESESLAPEVGYEQHQNGEQFQAP